MPETPPQPPAAFSRRQFLRVAGSMSILLPLAAACQSAAAPAAPAAPTAVRAAAAATSVPAASAATAAPAAPAATVAPAAAASGQPLQVLISSGGFADNMLIGIDQYRKTYPDRQVTINRIAHEQLAEKTLTDLATHTGSLDVAPIELPVSLQQTNSFLVPLQPYIDASTDLDFNDLLPPQIPSARFPYPDGQILTLPMRQGVDIMHYRKDLFDKAGLQPPQTFDDVVAAGLKFKKPDFFPITMHLKQGAYGVQEWLIVLHSMGGAVLSKDLTKVALGQPAIAATQWLMDLIYTHKLVSPTDLSSQVEDVVTNMQKGTAALGIFSSANIYDLDPQVVSDGGKIAYAAPPHGPGVAGGAGVFWAFGLGINKDSKNKDAAWDFIKLVAGKTAQIRMATEAGNGSPRASVYQDASVQAKNASATATMDALKTAQPKDPHPKWPEIEDELGSEISLALSQKKTAEQAMGDASTKIASIIGA